MDQAAHPERNGAMAKVDTADERRSVGAAEARTHVVDGNRLTLLPEGAERLEALLRVIGEARTSLRVLFYIYTDDASGRQVSKALAEAAGRGVAVSLVVDGFGSDGTPTEFFDPLRTVGVDVCRFSARWGRRYLLRNHQKLALADAETDGARVLVGGFNVEDDYFGDPTAGAWRDLGLLVEGPAAARIADYFDDLHAAIVGPRPRVRPLNRTLAKYSETHGGLRWLIGGPTRKLSPWARALRDDLENAACVDMIAGYFTPSPMLLRRIERKGRKPARLRVMTAAKSDNNATIAAARFTYAGLLKRGVRVFEYGRTKLHTKLYVVDDAVYIGSANFDVRSLFINLELMLRIEDRGFADAIRRYIEGEMAGANEVTWEAYRARTGWWQRIKQFGAYLLLTVVDPGVSRGLNFGIDEA